MNNQKIAKILKRREAKKLSAIAGWVTVLILFALVTELLMIIPAPANFDPSDYQLRKVAWEIFQEIKGDSGVPIPISLISVIVSLLLNYAFRCRDYWDKLIFSCSTYSLICITIKEAVETLLPFGGLAPETVEMLQRNVALYNLTGNILASANYSPDETAIIVCVIICIILVLAVAASEIAYRVSIRNIEIKFQVKAQAAKS